MNIKLSDLTLAGWLLTVATIGIVVVAVIFAVDWIKEALPGARRYPEALLAGIAVVAGLVFFALSALALRALGVPVVKRTPQAPPADSARK